MRIHHAIWLMLAMAFAAYGQPKVGEFRPTEDELVGGRFLPLQSQAALRQTRSSGLEERLCEAWREFSPEIDVSSYSIAVSEVRDLYMGILNQHDEFFYIKTSFSYTYIEEHIITIRPAYLFDKEEAEAKIAELEAAVSKALASIEDGMNEIDKALVLHDYIVLNCTYDQTQARPNKANAYGCLVEGTAVCAGYVQTYSLLLKRLGIPSRHVSSSRFNHAWNLVTIEGQDYHVDVTWDDPVGASINYVNHRYFLLDDTAMRAVSSHSEWDDPSLSGTSTRFDGYFWQNCKGMLPWDRGYVYAFDAQGNLMRCETATGATTILHTVPDKWYVWGGSGSYWVGCYSQIVKFNDLLVFNTSRAIYIWDPKRNEAKAAENEIDTEAGYAYGLYVRQGEELFWVRSTSPNEPGEPLPLVIALSATIQIGYGWNLVGIPFELNDASLEKLAACRTIRYEPNNYLVARSLLPGHAYWLWSNKAYTLKLTGFASTTAPQAEWRFVAPVAGADDIAPGNANAFRWDGKQFVPVDDLQDIPLGTGIILSPRQ